MKFYKDEYGRVFRVRNAEDMVTQMRDASRDPRDSVAEWMRITAEATKETRHKTIRCDSPKMFIDDLMGVGLLKEVKG